MKNGIHGNPPVGSDKTHLMALYVREKIADDMYKSAKTGKEKEFYKHELEDIRAEISNKTVCN